MSSSIATQIEKVGECQKGFDPPPKNHLIGAPLCYGQTWRWKTTVWPYCPGQGWSGYCSGHGADVISLQWSVPLSASRSFVTVTSTRQAGKVDWKWLGARHNNKSAVKILRCCFQNGMWLWPSLLILRKKQFINIRPRISSLEQFSSLIVT